MCFILAKASLLFPLMMNSLMIPRLMSCGLFIILCRTVNQIEFSDLQLQISQSYTEKK